MQLTEQQKYRKKPVVIEASQWFKNGDHPEDYATDVIGLENGVPRKFSGSYCKQHQWEGQIVGYYRSPELDGQTACKHCGDIMHNHGWIDTLEGGHIVCPGDWIITGVKGEHYPCKPDIFAATYEPVLQSAAHPVDEREGWFLAKAHLSHLAAKSLDDLIRRAKWCSVCDVDLRENGKNVRFEADWIKYMEPCHSALSAQDKQDAERYRFRHSTYVDPDGFEYGYVKVRWKNGKPETVLWASDDEIDAAMQAQGERSNTDHAKED